jgi:2-dehydropantoate 2-reductase
MHVGVLGAGSIGAYLGGRLIAAGVATTLVGRAALADAVARDGLRLTDYRGYDVTLPAARVPVATTPDALAGCDVVLVTVKGLDTDAAAAALAPVARPDALVVSFQNGVRNAERLRAALGDRVVLAGMVPFNVLRRGGAHLHQGTSGRLAVARAADGRHAALIDALARAGLPADAHDDMSGVLWGKLLLNLNNAVNALSGLPLRDELAQRGYRRVVAGCMREGLRVLAAASIRPRLETRLPPSLLPALLALPDALFRIAARPLITVDPSARSSMWDDLRRRRPTEIDLLNGELVALGARTHVPTPLNSRVVHLIKEAERAGALPALSAPALLRKLMAAG